MKKLAITLFLLVFVTACFESHRQGSKTDDFKRMRIKTVRGDILIEFYPKQAPVTVKRIKELVSEGFYSGLTFHRVIPGFVAQGGDPNGDGTGGSGVKIKAEFSQLKHKLGTVAMARAQSIHSADSQFYIVLGELPHLDGQYTIFGKVLEGIENVKKIKQGDQMITVTLE